MCVCAVDVLRYVMSLSFVLMDSVHPPSVSFPADVALQPTHGSGGGRVAPTEPSLFTICSSIGLLVVSDSRSCQSVLWRLAFAATVKTSA